MNRLLVLFLILAIGGAFGQPAETPTRDLSLVVGKSLVFDSPANIERVSVANGAIAEAVAITPREVVVNGKAAGETSLILWQQGGGRLVFDLKVSAPHPKLQAVQRELKKELGDSDVTIDVDTDSVFIRGTVPNLTSADRAVAIASTLGKPVNLLNVNVPPPEAQILLRVRFASVDRKAIQQLGMNIFSTGATNTIGSTGTGAFPAPQLNISGNSVATTLSDALNVFLFRKDLNLGATIKALEAMQLLQILAEPNVLAINGKPAAFLAGGEFPYPTLQGGGAGIGQVTIQYREFGVRLGFLPVMTPRGTIRLEVTPEVSSLDFANGLIFQGFTIPALATRRVQTEIELESGQSFVIGGLLDNRVTETLSKIPGLGDIPWLGKLFRSRDLSKSNTELLVLVTPELVRPIPADQKTPTMEMPKTFLKETQGLAVPRTPGLDTTGPVPVKPPQATMPVETLMELQKATQATPATPPTVLQMIPVPTTPPKPPDTKQ
ncbi:MAG: pilus assembly protein N-terminal domain-containing protein [Acidobacteriia bacterium]|nr:pilus assembly protein N-terminal domain-containing protein [Terriglobia bacterium]